MLHQIRWPGAAAHLGIGENGIGPFSIVVAEAVLPDPQVWAGLISFAVTEVHGGKPQVVRSLKGPLEQSPQRAAKQVGGSPRRGVDGGGPGTVLPAGLEFPGEGVEIGIRIARRPAAKGLLDFG